MGRKWNLLVYWLISNLKMTNSSQIWLIFLVENIITDQEFKIIVIYHKDKDMEERSAFAGNNNHWYHDK